MSHRHDIGSRYEEPDFLDDDTAECCKCSEHFDIEMMETKDCIEFVCAECKERDQLRKVCDELANIIYFHSLRPQNALDGYSQLPHVIARKAK